MQRIEANRLIVFARGYYFALSVRCALVSVDTLRTLKKENGPAIRGAIARNELKNQTKSGGGGEDRTPDLGVMNPETMHFRTVDTVRVFQLHQ